MQVVIRRLISSLTGYRTYVVCDFDSAIILICQVHLYMNFEEWDGCIH